MITEKKPTPVQVWNNFSLQREYLKTNYEEADVIIVHQLVRIASEAIDDSYIKVVCNDTDVFVLLIHFYIEKRMTMNVSMDMCWDNDHIRQTALKHKHIITYMPAVHALTGCDTVSCMFGMGKATALNELMSGHDLIELGQTEQKRQADI